MEKDLLVRYRIDGLCQEKLRLPEAGRRPPSSRA